MGIISQAHAQNVLKEMEQHGVMVIAGGRVVAVYQVNIDFSIENVHIFNRDQTSFSIIYCMIQF